MSTEAGSSKQAAPAKMGKTTTTKQSTQQKTSVNKCNVCDTLMPTTTVQIQCEWCKNWYHPNCVGLLAKDVKSNKKYPNYQWVCADCTGGSDTDDDTGNTADIRNAILIIMKRLDAIEAKHAELERSQEFLSSQHDSFGLAMLKCNEFTKQLRSDLTSVSQNCSVMKVEVDDVKSRQIVENQKRVVNTALIRGAKKEDDPSSVVQKIANVIQMDKITEKVESAKVRKSVNKECICS